MEKNLVLYFEKEYIPGEDPYENIKTGVEEKHISLFSAFPKHVHIYIAKSPLSHREKNIFLPQFQKSGSKWQELIGKTVDADLVIGLGIPTEVTNIFPSMRELTKDKKIIESIFPQYSFSSIVCDSYEDISTHFSNIKTELKVLKPQNGTRSKGIFIQKNIPQEKEIDSYPCILQEFFDTSGGFYEYPGLHDFRIIILNGEIIAKLLRQPEVGKYTANSFRRGNLIDLEDYTLPKEIETIVSEIENYCRKLYKHRYYSIDLGVGPRGEIKIFEMNSAPGLTTKKVAKKLGTYIAKNILKI